MATKTPGALVGVLHCSPHPWGSPLSGQLKLFTNVPDVFIAWGRPARAVHRQISANKKAPALSRGAVLLNWEPGGVLLSHGECHTTIVAAAFHF